MVSNDTCFNTIIGEGWEFALPQFSHITDCHGEDNERSAANTAKPFFVGQDELQQISGLVCQLQGRTRVQGAQESALPRAWRQFLGGEHSIGWGFGKGFSCEDAMMSWLPW